MPEGGASVRAADPQPTTALRGGRSKGVSWRISMALGSVSAQMAGSGGRARVDKRLRSAIVRRPGGTDDFAGRRRGARVAKGDGL